MTKLRNYEHLAARAFNTPILMEPGRAAVLLSAIADRLRIASIQMPDGTEHEPSALLSEASAQFGAGRQGKKVYQVVDGIAIIPVEGTLVHRLGRIDPYSGMTGYDGIAYKLQEAAADPEVKGIVLDIDSPGGEVCGCFDTAALVHEVAQRKPVRAIVNELAASAAYAIAAAATDIVLTGTAQVGSVGVVMAHADYSGALKNEGIAVTLVYAGAHKVDGHPYAALPDSVQARLQTEVEDLRQMFAGNVAKWRGMGADAVLATEARVYRGKEAISVGFAKKVMSARDAFLEFRNQIANPRNGGAAMQQPEKTETTPEKPTAAAAATPPAPTVDKAAVEAAARTEERGRIKAIIGAEAAVGRAKLAHFFAFDTDMDAKAAVTALEAAPKESQAGATAPGQLLDAAMKAAANADIGSDTKSDEQTTGADRLMASHRKATGKGE